MIHHSVRIKIQSYIQWIKIELVYFSLCEIQIVYTSAWLIAKKYCFAGTGGSSIRSLDVPLAIRNGTGPVDLICVYEVDEDENGLVIKWFHEAYQIYQWIPPSNLHFHPAYADPIITYMSALCICALLLNLP